MCYIHKITKIFFFLFNLETLLSKGSIFSDSSGEINATFCCSAILISLKQFCYATIIPSLRMKYKKCIQDIQSQTAGCVLHCSYHMKTFSSFIIEFEQWISKCNYRTDYMYFQVSNCSIYYRIQKWWAEREVLHFPEIPIGCDKFIKTEVQLLPKTSRILGKLICINQWKRYPTDFGCHS